MATMRKQHADTIKTIALVFLLILLTRNIDIFPWWSFVIPVLILGAVIGVKKWQVPGFATGFICGFIVWFGLNWYFDLTQNGIVLSKVGQLLSVPKIVILLMAGIIGGVLTGLALYAGKTMGSPANTTYKGLED